MADTDFGGFSLVTSLLTTDEFLALRAGGGINFTLATLAAAAAMLAGDGTVGVPGIAFASDADTGIYRPGANALGLVTGGSERIRITSGGNVGFGTANPSAKLEVVGGLKLSNGAADGPELILASAGYSDWYNDNNSGRWRIFYGGSEKFSVNGADGKAVFNGSSLYVRDDKLLLQHDGTDAYIRPSTGYLTLGASGLNRLRLSATDLLPLADNTIALGSGVNRYSVVYSTTGAINTSDERSKQQIGAIPDEWLDAWGDVEWSRYKFNDAVEAKGDDARWHLGLVAQRVRDAFAARDLDATTIGLLCYDEWEEEREPIYEEGVVDTETVVIGQEPTGVLDAAGNPVMRDITEERDIIGQIDTGETRVTLEAGDRWGLHYDECFAMEAAWQRREIAAQNARIAALEAA